MGRVLVLLVCLAALMAGSQASTLQRFRGERNQGLGAGICGQPTRDNCRACHYHSLFVLATGKGSESSAVFPKGMKGIDDWFEEKEVEDLQETADMEKHFETDGPAYKWLNDERDDGDLANWDETSCDFCLRLAKCCDSGSHPKSGFLAGSCSNKKEQQAQKDQEQDDDDDDDDDDKKAPAAKYETAKEVLKHAVATHGSHAAVHKLMEKHTESSKVESGDKQEEQDDDENDDAQQQQDDDNKSSNKKDKKEQQDDVQQDDEQDDENDDKNEHKKSPKDDQQDEQQDDDEKQEEEDDKAAEKRDKKKKRKEQEEGEQEQQEDDQDEDDGKKKKDKKNKKQKKEQQQQDDDDEEEEDDEQEDEESEKKKSKHEQSHYEKKHSAQYEYSKKVSKQVMKVHEDVVVSHTDVTITIPTFSVSILKEERPIKVKPLKSTQTAVAYEIWAIARDNFKYLKTLNDREIVTGKDDLFADRIDSAAERRQSLAQFLLELFESRGLERELVDAAVAMEMREQEAGEQFVGTTLYDAIVSRYIEGSEEAHEPGFDRKVVLYAEHKEIVKRLEDFEKHQILLSTSRDQFCEVSHFILSNKKNGFNVILRLLLNKYTIPTVIHKLQVLSSSSRYSQDQDEQEINEEFTDIEVLLDVFKSMAAGGSEWKKNERYRHILETLEEAIEESCEELQQLQDLDGEDQQPEEKNDRPVRFCDPLYETGFSIFAVQGYPTYYSNIFSTLQTTSSDHKDAGVIIDEWEIEIGQKVISWSSQPSIHIRGGEDGELYFVVNTADDTVAVRGSRADILRLYCTAATNIELRVGYVSAD